MVGRESGAIGAGHAHPNQPTTLCIGKVFDGAASDFFGTSPLPSGVGAGDTITAIISTYVILEP